MEFLKAFFDILITKTQPLFNDEIAAAIYQLILVDVDSFFKTFLPNYLDSVALLNPTQKTVLLENFTRETVSAFNFSKTCITNHKLTL